MRIAVTRDVLTAMGRAAGSAYPSECCGILLGADCRIDGILPTINVHPAPETHFEIDPQALIDTHRAARQGGPQVIGYYHSHPDGPARPSRTDAAMAAGDGRIWAILGADGIGFWQDAPDGFVAISYDVTGP
jgi:proteasome lid subunit RPN8/RPN11